jgi:hypothetical protein
VKLLLTDYLACNAFFKSSLEINVGLKSVVNELVDVVRCIGLKVCSRPTVSNKSNGEHPLQPNHFDIILLFAQLVEKTFK